ncbi:efflux transporter outer membrane subunit [Rubrivivax gelatinosus]|uniref:RND transporter n=1 Tax=Rubrivivax gelatinosus TaxID=28068 RepID=A0ABS1DY90_RUBGE|nr:efflux transporter outer membrane subunit [Rubrivivax gelatinosus]MBK1715057.1 RND transporter [Rubrivivax gelatinosus]
MSMRPPFHRLAPPALAVLLLSACAAVEPPPSPPAVAPPHWQAPLPHGGRLADLTRWWQQFDDPLLTQLIDAAQQESPSLAAAASRLEQSRAARVAAGAALLPTLDATASMGRGRSDLGTPIGSSRSAGLQASWELDLFGGVQAARAAAQARLDGAQASWHAARVSVAAEVAGHYVALRACEAQVVQTRADAASRAESARLTELSARAGFQSLADAALARASAAQGNALLTARQAQCDAEVKALVALTGADEPGLRGRLAAATARLPRPAQIAVHAVPGELLNQRPDLYASGRELVAASGDLLQSRAAALPRITLAGSVDASRLDYGASQVDGTTWSVGPLAVTLPLFDAGTRRANVEAARAAYDAAAVAYRGQLRSAVREVEEALVQLDSTAVRAADARTAAEGYEYAFRATERRHQSGAASLFELEDARRSAVQAQSELIDLQRERVAAWISLYRALGGGWTSADAAAADPQAQNR